MGRSKVYACPAENCGKVFLSFQSIKEHRKVHGTERYSCTEPGCTKTFKWRSSLASHKKSHLVKRERPGSPASWDSSVSLISNEGSSCDRRSPMSDNSCLNDVGVLGCDHNDDVYFFPCNNLNTMSVWDNAIC
eukprot:Plantae.Rhodophyta-Purpureofilum_apyrenoidigerum.ctg15195.p1 GENE.Plantae.Rhodophyta-Purpureofilum_apyrenoidigerum.ctg15195~~Plantae.Rhodophyta-Purpureofilum_apyrenoidigerum.ctg15195.p1  ORF type:complete len:133 (+),score=16.03 Plantae.Rhodophyta-Purpureofilum_apyrenoidigerum.ctg15195:491-889(+)